MGSSTKAVPEPHLIKHRSGDRDISGFDVGARRDAGPKHRALQCGGAGGKNRTGLVV